MNKKEITRQITRLAKQALTDAKDHPYPVSQSERLFEIYCDEFDPALGLDSADERRDILDNVAEGKDPWARWL
jgi:hypothetical protein